MKLAALLPVIGGISEMWDGCRLVIGYVDDNSRLKSVYTAAVKDTGFAIGKGYREKTQSYPKLVIRGFQLGSTALGAPVAVGFGRWVDTDYR